eukprot:375508-Amphidinium_carterae.1
MVCLSLTSSFVLVLIPKVLIRLLKGERASMGGLVSEGMGAGASGATLDACLSLAMLTSREGFRLVVFVGSGIGCAVVRAAVRLAARTTTRLVVMETDPLCAAMALILMEWTGPARC